MIGLIITVIIAVFVFLVLYFERLFTKDKTVKILFLHPNGINFHETEKILAYYGVNLYDVEFIEEEYNIGDKLLEVYCYIAINKLEIAEEILFLHLPYIPLYDTMDETKLKEDNLRSYKIKELNLEGCMNMTVSGIVRGVLS
jgi:hypothetical protein